MLLAKTFTVLMEPVLKPAAEITTSQKPFFDRGASTSSLTRPASVTGPSLVQATSEAVDEMQTATQPLEAPGAGTATQPVQAPGSVLDVLPSGTGDVDLSADQTLTGRVIKSSSASDSEDGQQSVTSSLSEGNYQDGSPEILSGKSLQIKNFHKRTTIVRQSEKLDLLWVGTRFLSSRLCPLLKTTLLPVYMSKQPVKCQSSSRWMTGYVKRWTSLTSPSHKGTL